MKEPIARNSVAPSLCNVNTAPDGQIPLFTMPSPALVTPHKVPYRVVSYQGIERARRYGIPSEKKALPPGVFRKRYDMIREFLRGPLGLTTAQREVVLRLLQLWSYYPEVYPKVSQLSELPGCSRSTVFRTLRHLESRGLIAVIHRYVLREKAQISSLYRLTRLIMAIVRYLQEKGVGVAGRLAELAARLSWRELLPPTFYTSTLSASPPRAPAAGG